jgi:hypothetical protein
MIEGGCFCGAIRYAIDDGSYPSLDCHCTMCRRVHAATVVTWLVVPVENHRYLAGHPKVLRSSGGGTRCFCADCGSPVACINEAHPDIIDIPVGSLDNPRDFPPTRSFFNDTRLPWLAHVMP